MKCENCGKDVDEKDAVVHGEYTACSKACMRKLLVTVMRAILC